MRQTTPSVALGWQRSRMSGFQNAVVAISRPDAAIYDPVTNLISAALMVSYDGYSGGAHIYNSSGSSALFTGEQMEVIETVMISIPWDTTPVPRTEDLVMVLSSNDTDITNKAFRIIDTTVGGVLYLVRTLTCTFVQDNPFRPDA